MLINMHRRVAICIASGPSLIDRDVNLAVKSGFRIAVCNDNYRRAPDADLLYAQDERWWAHHINKVRAQGFRGELWGGSATACAKYQLKHATITKDVGWVCSPCFHTVPKSVPIAGGALSGYQMVNLVGNLWTPKIILLLGYDHQETNGMKHWFGNHPPTWPNVPNLARDLPYWTVMKNELPASLEIINVSRETAITCFPRMTIDEGIEYAKSHLS